MLTAAAATADCAIVGGGDGSLRMAAAGIEASGLALGILPLGTANDLARTLGIPDDPVAAADVILAGHRRVIDLGTVNGEPFFNVASIGLATELARELSGDLKKRWGRLGYAIAAIRTLAKARRFTAWITESGPDRPHPHHADRRRQRAVLRRRQRRRRACGDRRRASRPLQPRDAHGLAAGADALELPLRRARRLVRGHDAARHRVRGPHRQPAPGQRRRRDRHRDAGALPRPSEGDHRLRAAPGRGRAAAARSRRTAASRPPRSAGSSATKPSQCRARMPAPSP